MHQIVPFVCFFKTFPGEHTPVPPSMASRLLRSHENILCLKYCASLTWSPGSAPAVLSLQCQTFGIQIRLNVLFGMIWVQLLVCRLHHRYHTEFLAADIFQLVFLRRIYKLRISFEILKTYLRTLVRFD